MSEGKDYDFDDEDEDYEQEKMKRKYDEQKDQKDMDYDDDEGDDEDDYDDRRYRGRAETDEGGIIAEDVFNLAKDYCRKPEFLKVFEQYIRDYVDYFDRDLYQEGEHPHEWHDYFQTCKFTFSTSPNRIENICR
eukprot:g2470.t1